VLQNEFWSRVFTFVPTATKDDGEEIDEKRFLETIDFQIENGVDGICIFGSTGGNGSFTDEEMKKATALAAAFRWLPALARAPQRRASHCPSMLNMLAAMASWFCRFRIGR
jgi:hypothetical protein